MQKSLLQSGGWINTEKPPAIRRLDQCRKASCIHGPGYPFRAERKSPVSNREIAVGTREISNRPVLEHPKPSAGGFSLNLKGGERN